jgi:hypothetical protein
MLLCLFGSIRVERDVKLMKHVTVGGGAQTVKVWEALIQCDDKETDNCTCHTHCLPS